LCDDNRRTTNAFRPASTAIYEMGCKLYRAGADSFLGFWKKSESALLHWRPTMSSPARASAEDSPCGATRQLERIRGSRHGNPSASCEHGGIRMGTGGYRQSRRRNRPGNVERHCPQLARIVPDNRLGWRTDEVHSWKRWNSALATITVAAMGPRPNYR